MSNIKERNQRDDEQLSSREQRERFLENLVYPNTDQAWIIAAYENLDFGAFVPPNQQHLFYEGKVIPLPGTTISETGLTVRMLSHLHLQPGSKVLDIGTGSGLTAYLLAQQASEVYTMDISEGLVTKAEATIRAQGITNVHFFVGDGALGLPDHGPYDALLATVAPLTFPPTWGHQVKDEGILVLPMGENFAQGELIVVKREGEEIRGHGVEGVKFMPLISEREEYGGWNTDRIRSWFEQNETSLSNYLSFAAKSLGRNLSDMQLSVRIRRENGAKLSDPEVNRILLSELEEKGVLEKLNPV